MFWTRFFCFVLIGGLVLREASLELTPADTRAVFLVRQGENTTVPCWNSWSTRYKDARFTWLDHLERGAARNEMILHGDGTMEVPDAQLSDTDSFKCVIHLPGNVHENYTHTIIVFMLAEYYMSYPFIYIVPECNYQLDNFKMHELHEFVCRDYERNCPFHAVVSCKKYQASESEIERSQLVVFIQQYPLDVYRPPSCDVLCIKKSIWEHFSLMGSYIIGELFKLEQNSQRKIYGNIIFRRDMSARLTDVKTRCQSGYELFQDIFCMPCHPGYFLKYDTTEEELVPTRIHQSCEPCPSGQYQDSFGMDDCFYCPKSTYTRSNGSVSQELCRKKVFPLSWTLMILCGLLAAFLFAICCTWLIMVCVSGTHEWRVKKIKETGADDSATAAAVTTAESEYPPLNEQQPWMEIFRQCEESAKSSSPGGSPLPTMTLSPTGVVMVPAPPGASGVVAPSPGAASLRPVLKQRPSTSPTDYYYDDDGTLIYVSPEDSLQRPTVTGQDAYPTRPPPQPSVEYSIVQALPEPPAPGTPPTPLQPFPVATATPRTTDDMSVVSIRPAMRPAVRQPVPLTSKTSDTNIYRKALISGLREVRIMPPGTGVRMSRSVSAENWSQQTAGEAGGGGHQREGGGPSNASSNSKPVVPPSHSGGGGGGAQLQGPSPSITPHLSRDQSGVVAPLIGGGQPLRGQKSGVEFGRQSSQRGSSRPVEIEVEFQRMAPPSSSAGFESQRGSLQQDRAAASRHQSVQPSSIRHRPRQSSPGKTAAASAEAQEARAMDSELTVEFERRQTAMMGESRSFGSRSSIPWSQLQQDKYEEDRHQQQQNGPRHSQHRHSQRHIHQQQQQQQQQQQSSSGSNQTSDTETRSRLSIVHHHRRQQQGDYSQTPSQQSSSETTTTQQTSQPSQQSSSETGRYTATASQQSSEVDQSLVSRMSSEMMEEERQRSSMATHPRYSRSGGPEADESSSHGRPVMVMRKGLIEAIYARSTPIHEDNNVYD